MTITIGSRESALAIVQSHGGSIDVDSSTAPEDHGTTFSVRLPAAAVEE